MLDWMKKLFKKEEENEATALKTIETSAEKKVTSQIPRVKYYSDKREADLQASKPNSGSNFRFPLIPDNGFDESTQESSRLEKLAIQEGPIRERRRSRRVEEVQEMTYIEPSTEKVKPTSKVETNRRPFRPSEMLSPVFGYNRPQSRQKENEESKQQQREDIEISMEGKSVVDAWLEKNGYISSDSSQDELTEVESTIVKTNGEQTEDSKSVVNLEKNEAALHSHEEQLDKFEDVTEQIHTSESEVQESNVIETRFEMTEEVEESVEIEESLEESVTEEVISEVAEESVMEEVISEVAEESVMEEVISEVAEESVMEEVIGEVAEESVTEEVISEVTEESVTEEVISEVAEESVTEEVISEVAEESVTEEVISEVTEESVTEEVISEVAEESVTEEVISEVAEESVTEEVISEVAEESVTEEVISEVAEESVTEEVISEVAEESVMEEVISEVTEESVMEEMTEEVEESVEIEESLEEELTEEVISEVAEFVTTEEHLKTGEFAELEESTVEGKEFGLVVETSSIMEDSDMQEETSIVEESVIQEETPVAEESVEIEESFEAEVSEETEVVDVSLDIEELITAEFDEVPKAESFTQEQTEKFIQADEQTQQAVQSFANVIIEETQAKKQPEVKAEQKEKVIEEPKREKKRFVPFNVVMLKQDKQMLEEKRRVAMATQPAHTGPEQKQNIEPPVQEEMTHRVVVETVQDVRNVLQAPPTYEFPPLTLLNIPNHSATNDAEWLEGQKELLNTTFHNFHIGAKVVNVTQGPAVTRFEVQPDPGVKVNKITNLSDDIKLNLAARDIRIEAPIPGKNAVGIEVPNKESKAVFLREILRSPVFTKSESPLTVALGLDISGTPIVTDIRKMPHGLIAGSTGSGKSVCINAILTSILYKAKPHEVKLMLIDPKMVELAPYNSVPHLVAPVITDVKAATAALKWAVDEMERRYELFAHAGARDLSRYNTIMNEQEIPGETLPYIVIVIDELADLMMVAPGDVEEAICRIAQKARACGIHLLVATQRPSVDVITGLIKSNIPTRIAFTVSSQVDSRTIIDIGGAEKLLGRGDMLFLDNGTSKPVRVQGVYVSDEEIEKSVAHAKRQMKPNYLFQQEDLLAKTEQQESEDELFFEACQFVVEQGGASTSSVQRRFRIGYNRAARLIEEMEAQGIISEARGTKPRDVLITEDEFAAMQDIHV
ncbi:DNA translocase FtsK [Bacillus sp. S10(2024)]|uniref:DNA translocase FtsK n=1 Tax=Bacillus sp. S10(2024) TaxID=3162886 RepID=UPI003D2170DB